ncbi:MAG: hypothetical protein EBR30_08260 [Cytophagia bacterium]|nr:hypothetical protein [Cytophagia bacterium]NBW34998.1 hypothetical protein [Cytophagia bacterium]
MKNISNMDSLILKKATRLEYLSLIPLIASLAYFKLWFVIAGGSIGLILQFFAFSYYKSIDQHWIYLKRKLLPILVSLLLIAYLMIKD